MFTFSSCWHAPCVYSYLCYSTNQLENFLFRCPFVSVWGQVDHSEMSSHRFMFHCLSKDWSSSVWIEFRFSNLYLLTPLTGLTFYKHPLGSQNIAAESVYQKSQLPWTGIWNEYSWQCVQSTHTWKIHCKVFKWKSLNGTTNAAVWYESCRRDLNVKCSMFAWSDEGSNGELHIDISSYKPTKDYLKVFPLWLLAQWFFI